METQDQKNSLQPGDVVQLDPATTENPKFAGCLMIVDKTYSWGIQGYVPVLVDGGGQAYYRATWGTFESTGGKAVWTVN